MSTTHQIGLKQRKCNEDTTQSILQRYNEDQNGIGKAIVTKPSLDRTSCTPRPQVIMTTPKTSTDGFTMGIIVKYFTTALRCTTGDAHAAKMCHRYATSAGYA
ncbi:hypothetical protein OPT61_g10133 [Boeremia exigua]|uniref:Uncharacterized protein n=1 Tax=Boeremia exigua TaxID=749465 RepID=A0ACC2HRJ9_9PLEO|nr:hypothetical protein OPT61_g10133 [Boeremia exigua]